MWKKKLKLTAYIKESIDGHFFQRRKFLISLTEGIDTSSLTGQQDLIAMINRGWDRIDSFHS